VSVSDTAFLTHNKNIIMTLEERISEDIKRAMLAKDADRLAALRAVKAAILVEKTSGSAHEVSDADVTKIMQKLATQRKESATIYTDAGRAELADKELSEAAVIEEYLPKQLSEAELEAALREIITKVGATTPAEMGKVMGVASKQLAGLADGRLISETVKRLLSE
jgi:uncharacterized protein YqeY